MPENSALDLLAYTLHAALLLVPLWKITARAGISSLFSLLIFIPHLGILVVAIVLAFAPWKESNHIKGEPNGH